MKHLTGTVYSEALERIEQCRKLGVHGFGLDLSGMGLVDVPSEIGHLRFLRYLNLANNRIKALPPQIGLLIGLRKFWLQKNDLEHVPEEIGKLSNLQELYLHDNKLVELPQQIGGLTMLQRLDVSNNALASVPWQIGKLKALRALGLSSNHLSKLPDQIGTLSKLTDLYLNDNRLTSIPNQVGSLPRIARLVLANNQLGDLPEELRDHPSLRWIYLHQNPALELLEEVLGPTWQDVERDRAPSRSAESILNYFFDTRGDGGVPLNEMKLLVVGRGNVGKTSLIKRLKNKPLDLHEPETHGLLIRPLTLRCSDCDITARVWDFGGQQVLHAMHEFFLTARSIYLLVLDQRSDEAETDAEYWLQLIRAYAGDAPVIVALNKSCGIDRQIDKRRLEKEYGPILGWVPTDCLPEHAHSISALRLALTKAAEAHYMPESRKRIQRKWMRIKSWLENMEGEGVCYVNFQEFIQRCKELGEPNLEKLSEVASLMHDLGIAMHYARDGRFRDSTIIRPDWLANGVYALLRANLLPQGPLAPNGQLTLSIVGRVFEVASSRPTEMLHIADYPSDKWSYLLELMCLFELCFPMRSEEQNASYLCPALLGESEPEGCDEPDGEGALRIQYDFQVVPVSLIGRVTVKLFPFINDGLIWRRGVVLRYLSARAKVWTRKTFICVTISGQPQDRDELEDIIRGAMASLLADYNKMKFTECLWMDNAWTPRALLVKLGLIPIRSLDKEVPL